MHGAIIYPYFKTVDYLIALINESIPKRIYRRPTPEP